MLDKESVRQQEAAGCYGVNLLYGAFLPASPTGRRYRSLLDDLTLNAWKWTLIRFRRPAFARVDNRLDGPALVPQDT